MDGGTKGRSGRGGPGRACMRRVAMWLATSVGLSLALLGLADRAGAAPTLEAPPAPTVHAGDHRVTVSWPSGGAVTRVWRDGTLVATIGDDEPSGSTWTDRSAVNGHRY